MLFVKAQRRKCNKEIQLSTYSQSLFSVYELSEAILYQNVLHSKQRQKQS